MLWKIRNRTCSKAETKGLARRANKVLPARPGHWQEAIRAVGRRPCFRIQGIQTIRRLVSKNEGTERIPRLREPGLACQQSAPRPG